MQYNINENHIIFSFKYSISNKKYTLNEVLNGKDKCNKVMQKLFEKFEELSKITWKELRNRPKETGYEMIPISEFKVSLENIKKELNLSDDSKIIVFRFNNQKSRMLGVQSSEYDAILYVIGYDWDFSAYNHGS